MEKIEAYLFTESGMGQYILGIFVPSLEKVIKFQTIKLFSFIDACSCKGVCGTRMRIEIDPAGFEEAYDFVLKEKERNKEACVEIVKGYLCFMATLLGLKDLPLSFRIKYACEIKRGL